MTNTLHRYGDKRNLRNDFIVFAIPCRGHNDEDSVPKLKRFLRAATKYKPVNLGDGSHGGAYRPSKNLNPTAHWLRESEPDFEAVIEGVTTPTTVAAVFDNIEAVEEFVAGRQAFGTGQRGPERIGIGEHPDIGARLVDPRRKQIAGQLMQLIKHYRP